MSDFKLRPLHRRRSRRKRVSVLNHAELAERFGVAHEEVKAKLLELGWRFHEDSSGGLWAKPQDGDLGRL